MTSNCVVLVKLRKLLPSETSIDEDLVVVELEAVVCRSVVGVVCVEGEDAVDAEIEPEPPDAESESEDDRE